MPFSQLCYDIIKKIVPGITSHYVFYPDLQQFVAKEDQRSREYLTLPSMAFWDPLRVYPEIYCPHCEGKKSLCHTDEWETGQRNSLIPRTMKDLTWYIALVGRQYKCCNLHKIVSYHAGILKQIPLSEQPFMLGHQFAISNEVYDFVMRSVESGCLFETIENALYGNFYDSFLRKMRKMDSFDDDEDLPILKEIYKPLSNDTLLKIFMVNYQQNFNRYKQDFKEVCCKSICIDHTFKAAANIGFTRDTKWNKLYDSLFIILNEFGKVKDFKFASGCSLDKVHSNLVGVSSDIEAVYTDDCCKLKFKLNAIYPNAVIKLDLFHAVARLTKHMSNRHPLHKDAVREIGLMFRKSGDIGEERQLPTASEVEIEECMMKYLGKWKTVSVEGWPIINERVEKAFENLLVHVKNGCLTNIPPGMGTNRNENLHKQLRKYLRNRLSLQTAEALFTHLFYVVNCKKSLKKGTIPVPPIWRKQKKVADGGSIFNLPQKIETYQSVCARDQLYEFLLEKELGQSEHDYAGLFQLIALVRSLDKINQSISSSLKHRLFRYQGFNSILTSYWDLQEYIQKCKTGDEMDSETYSSVLKELKISESENQNNDILNVILQVVKIICERQSTSTDFKACFQSLELVELKEFIKKEADILLSEEVFSDANPNHVFSCAANYFGITFIVIPSTMGFPMFPIIPKKCFIEEPQFLVLKCSDSVFLPLSKEKNEDEKVIRCKCGSHLKDTKSSSCVANMRCSCLRQNKRCSALCRCTNCGNNKEIKKTCKRRKRVQPTLTSTLGNVTSFEYAMSIGEQLEKLQVTSIQHFFLEALVFNLTRSINSSFDDLDADFSKKLLWDEYEKVKDQISLIPEVHHQGFDIVKSSFDRWFNSRVKKHENLKAIYCST